MRRGGILAFSTTDCAGFLALIIGAIHASVTTPGRRYTAPLMIVDVKRAFTLFIYVTFYVFDVFLFRPRVFFIFEKTSSKYDADIKNSNEIRQK